MRGVVENFQYQTVYIGGYTQGRFSQVVIDLDG